MNGRIIAMAGVVLLCLGTAARAEDPQGAGTANAPPPDAPSDAKPQPSPPPSGDGDQQALARCGDEIKTIGQAAGNPAAVREEAAAHERRVRAVVKLYVAEELQKSKNAKGCLERVSEARQLMAALPGAASPGAASPGTGAGGSTQ